MERTEDGKKAQKKGGGKMKERKRQRRKVKEKREKKGGYAACPHAFYKHLVPKYTTHSF